MRLERWTSPSGRGRWLTRLDPGEARVYARAVHLAFPGLELGPRSFATPPRPGRSWRGERLAWRRAVLSDVATAELVIVSDVAACYPSIGEAAVAMAVRRAGGTPGPLVRELARLRDAGVRGLPVGPSPSAVVGEAILSIADECARVAGVAPIRWVDDVVFAGDRATVQRAARAWARALGEVGLREHEGKRHTVDASGIDGIDILGTSCRTGPMRHGIIRTS